MFKDIKGYEGRYMISDRGEVYSVIRGKLLKPSTDYSGYQSVKLYYNGISKGMFIHRLVALNFLEIVSNKPHVNHIDGVRDNNSLSNLEWCTPKENIENAMGRQRFKDGRITTGRLVSKKVEMLDSSGNILNIFTSITEASYVTGTPRSNISKVCKGKRTTAGGNFWRYKEDD